jgi:hypothetical protein
MTTSTIEEEIRDTDDAFMSAVTPKELNGITLKPFSLMRQSISTEISGLDTETAFFEAVVRVWLCTLEPMECIKAKRNRDQAVIDAFAWAEAQGISPQNGKPLMDLYKRINDEIRQSTNAVSENDSDPSPNAGGQPV